MKPLFSIDQVASILQLPSPEVESLIECEHLHAIEVMPGVLRVDPADLRTFIEARRRGFRPRLEPV